MNTQCYVSDTQYIIIFLRKHTNIKWNITLKFDRVALL